MALEHDIQELTKAVQALTLAMQGANNVKTTKAEKSATTATTPATSTATETSAPVSANTATEPTAEPPGATTAETEQTPEDFYKTELLPKFKDLLSSGQQAKAKAALTKFNVAKLAELPANVDTYKAFLVEIGG